MCFQGEIDPKSSNLYYRTEGCPSGGCDNTPNANRMKCMAGQVGNVFTRVADKEMGEDVSTAIRMESTPRILW